MYINKFVSIIIPVYNTQAPILIKCINSLLNQDYSNFEILLIDDGSTDDYAAEYDKIALFDNRIKIFHKSNGGVSSARNLGLKNAGGEYIAFVDSDDWVDNNFLSLLVSSIESQNADLSIVGVDYVYKDAANTDTAQNKSINKVLLLNKSELYTKLLHSDNVGGYLCNKLFKRELINRFLDESLHLCEDFEFVAHYCQKVNCASYICEKAYHYLQKNNSGFEIPKYSSRSFSLIYAREKITDIYRINSPENLFAMEKSVLKAALNLRARYKLSKANNKEEYAVISATVKKYFKRIITTKDISLTEKLNIIFTYIFPTVILRTKTFVLERKRKNA